MRDSGIRYAEGPDGHVAYRVLGDGPLDLVLCENWVTNLVHRHESPLIARLDRRLASFARLVLFDKRGTGISDPVPSGSLSAVPTVEEAAQDVRTILDEIGSTGAALLGTETGGWVAMQFAATYPERVSALVVTDPIVRFVADPTWPWGIDQDLLPALLASVRAGYDDEGAALRFLAPDLTDDTAVTRWYVGYLRTATPPGPMLAYWRSVADLDFRGLLPAIQAPTLVVGHRDVPFNPAEAYRHVAEVIPHARLLEVDGANRALWAPQPTEILDEIERFLTGDLGAPPEVDRVLATVLFTDIVDSTQQAADLGDRRWQELLDLHNTSAQRMVDRWRGTWVKSTGDGILARFDGPARAVRCAWALREELRAAGLRIRAGLHTGEINCASDGDIAGLAVHLAARVLSASPGDDIVATRTVKDLVAGSGIAFCDVGVHAFKGIPDEWPIVAVTSA